MEEIPITVIEKVIEFKPENKPVTVIQRNLYDPEDSNTYDGRIVGIANRKNRKLIKVKVDESYDPFFDYGILVSTQEGGEITVTYTHGRKENFTFIDTSMNEKTYDRRTEPITFDELDRLIKDRLSSVKNLITTEEYAEEQLNKAKTEHDYAVITYVKHSNDKVVRNTITSYIDTLWPTLDKEILVYRGQLNAKEIRTSPAPPRYFFSTSTMDSVSTGYKFFSHEAKCCLFILHIQPGVKYFEVTGELTGGESEAEILIEGNGTFYQDKGKTLPGFRQLTMQELILNKDRLGIRDTYEQFFKSGKVPTQLQQTELQKKIGMFEAYYFPPTREGGRKRRNTYRNKKNRRRQTRKRT